MRLYVNESRTQWAGTQADAKKAFGNYDMCDVPTDKSGLLEFLNSYAPAPETTTEPVSQAPAPPPAQKQRDTLVERCELVELKKLSTMLNTLLHNTWNEMERFGED
jgi:hypothetical protein